MNIIFGVVECYDPLWCDSYYYIFYFVKVGSNKTFNLISRGSKSRFPNWNSRWVNIVVFQFCLTIDENTLCISIVNQHSNIIVPFDVSGFSAGGKRRDYDLTVHVSVTDRNSVYGSVFVVGANSAILFSLSIDSISSLVREGAWPVYDNLCHHSIVLLFHFCWLCYYPLCLLVSVLMTCGRIPMHRLVRTTVKNLGVSEISQGIMKLWVFILFSELHCRQKLLIAHCQETSTVYELQCNSPSYHYLLLNIVRWNLCIKT